MAYRDMTFCTFHTSCANGKVCERALTDDVRKGAEEWWGRNGDPPISVFLKKPQCWVKK